MNAYFDLIKQLLFMSLWMFCLVIPFLFIYSRGSALDKTPMAIINQFSLGNLGGSSTACGQVPFGIEGAAINLACQAGELNTFATDYSSGEPVIQIGVINKSQTRSNFCSNTAFTDAFNCN